MASYHWEVRWIPLPAGKTFEDVNEILATTADGWEPFAAMPNEDGWLLLVRRKVEAQK